MAVLANTFETYESVGIREDLADVIYDISPTDTPFMSNIPKTTSKGTFHEWQKDALEAPADTPVSEGAEAAILALTPTVRLGNYTQIASKAARISGTDLVADNAGRQSEMAYQMAKKGLEIRNDIEYTLVAANKGYNAGNPETTGAGDVPREVATLHAWFSSAESDIAGDGVAAVGDGSDGFTDGTARDFTEDMLTAAHQATWVAGGDPSIIMCGATLKTAITGFTGNATKYKEVDDKKIINAVDVYVSDFGELMVVPNRWMRATDVFLLQPDTWAYATHRDFLNWDLAKTGDSEAKQILTEYTMEARSAEANFFIGDLQKAAA